MRLQRINISTPELDKQENDWWNTNCDLIETIWANSYELQMAIRAHYLNRMKAFFMKDAKKLPLQILEVGCGTGWVCRLVADENFHVLGTDFSASQIQKAKEQAIRFKKDQFCKYELADASTFSKEYDGVVIHALLHHLSTQELDTFFAEFGKLKKGTKVFMYEPVFFEPNNKTVFVEKILNRIILHYRKKALENVENTKPVNQELLKKWNSIDQQATENGWYISPKEVPFYEDEIKNYLDKYCNIIDHYVVNKTDLEVAQKMTLHDINQPDAKMTNWIQKIQHFESQLFKRNFRPFIYRDQHLFVCYELIIK